MIYKIKKNIRRFSNKFQCTKKIYAWVSEKYVMLFSLLSDEKYAKLKYKQNTGRKLNLNEPTTFNEKLWWLKLNNRDPFLTLCSDKVLVKDYIKSIGLGDILIKNYGVFSSVKEIDFNKIPDKSFIKMNNGSGTNWIYYKDNFNKKKFEKVFSKALKSNYYYKSREWNYKNIEPKILVEENISLKTQEKLIDYRFLCFDGKVKLVFVDIDTSNSDGTHYYGAKRNIYNVNFERLDIKAHREHFDSPLLNKPKLWNKMIEYAEKISSPFVFARVDLYNVQEKIYFGEITFYTGGATQIFEPENIEVELGQLIDLSSEKIVKRLK